MPMFDGLPVLEKPDPDDIPRGITAFGVRAPGFELDPHRHRKGQLLFTLRGVLSCEVDSGLWLVPPHCAIWIPGGATHAIKASGDIEGYDVFIDPALTETLPPICCTVAVTPLLRELLIRAASLPLDYVEDAATGHLIGLLLAELAMAPMERLHLPMPEDRRLRRIAEMIVADPSDRATITGWARRAGLSERTLARLLKRETGMSFGRWRQQLSIMIALRRMAEGASVQRVADDLGYESAGSFVTMFRKALGAAPARYMATMQSQAAKA